MSTSSLALGPELTAASAASHTLAHPEWVMDPPYILRYLPEHYQQEAVKIQLKTQIGMSQLKTQQLEQMVELVERAGFQAKG